MMIANQPPPFSVPTIAMNKNHITSVGPNDILLGRGPGPCNNEGNRRFRLIIRKHRPRYTSGKRLEKQRLGQEILDEIHQKGGRFLKLVDPSISSTTYFEVSGEVARAKIKQALREHRNEKWWTEYDDETETVADGKKTRDRWTRALPAKKRHPFITDNKDWSSIVTSGGQVPQNVASLSMDATSSPSWSANNVSPSLGGTEGILTVIVTSPHTGAIRGVPTLPAALPSALLLPLSSVPVGSDDSSLAILSPLVPTVVSIDSTNLSTVDKRLHLFQDPYLNVQGKTSFPLSAQPILAAPSFPFTGSPSPWDCWGTTGQGFWQNINNARKSSIVRSHERSAEDESIDSILRDFSAMQTSHGGSGKVNQERQNGVPFSSAPAEKAPEGYKDQEMCKAIESHIMSRHSSAASMMTEEDVAAFLLGSLTLVDRPVVTEEQEAMERASLTTKEKAEVISDALGLSAVRSSHKSKRARTTLDRKSTAFLVRIMKIEIEKIPIQERQALVQAQRKCGIHEFSDTRLEQFLRSEGWNTKLAARRFVNYWESRRQVFGPEKYVQRMTLSEALRDEMAAFQASVFCLLPKVDASGRRLLFLNVARHTLEGYTSESLVRAVWYLYEITAQEERDIVQICWFKGASLFDYDLKVYDQLAYFMSACLPVRIVANHLCCLPRIVACVVKPIIHSFMSRDLRTHTIQHDVPEDEIVEFLANYGISRDVLPTCMAGTVDIDQGEWIANRRAIELEEI